MSIFLNGSLSDFEQKYGNSSNVMLQKMLAAARAKYGVDEASNFGQFADLEKQLRDAGYGDLVDSARSQWTSVFSNYHEGLLDRLGGAFGARSGFDKNREYALAQYGEALNGIAQQIQQNEFNSPNAQAERMRLAGQNPDLLGTGDVSSAASPAEDTNNVLPETAAFTLDQVSQYGQFLISLPTSVLAFAKDIRSLKSLKLANEGQELVNEGQELSNKGQEIVNDTNMLGVFSNLYKTTKEGILGAVDENDVDFAYVDDDPNNPDVNKQVEMTLHKQLENARQRFLRTVKSSGISPKLYSAVEAASEEYFGSMDFATELAERRSRYFNAKVQKSRIRNSRFVGGNQHMFDSFLDSLNKYMTFIIDDITEFSAKSQAWTLRNSSEYQSQFNLLGGPNTTASNDITTSTYQRQNLGLQNDLLKLQKNINEAREQMRVDLKKLADSGNTWARIGLYLIQGFEIAKGF